MLLIVVVQISFATITVDSVSTVSSTCSNNGSATVFARRIPSGFLLYAIVAGPVTSPLQNSNTFSSLYPGNYTARVYDTNFDSTETQFQVGGNYQLPNFSVVSVDPTCPGFNDGSAIAIVDTTFGLQPYTFQLISPSTGAMQTSNYFQGLTDNTYQIRMTDACGNYQTRTAVLLNSGTGLVAWQSPLFPSVTKIGCDTMEMTTYCYLYKEKGNLPLTLTLNTSSGTITKTVYAIVVDTINYNPGYYKVVDTIPNIDYGAYLQVTLTDVCGQSVASYFNQIAPFEWELIYQPVTVNCVATFTAYLQLQAPPNYPYFYTTAYPPTAFTLVDLSTNTIVDSMNTGFAYTGLQLHAETPGQLYHLTVTGGCGEVWELDIVWPTSGSPIVNIYPSYGCLDSTMSLQFQCIGFQSAVTVHILSGPDIVQSTKPRFAYRDTIMYPRVFMGLYLPNSLTIKDCTYGNYTFEVTDSCGNVVQGSFYVDISMLSHLSYFWYVKPSCLNNNTVYYNFAEGTNIAVFASITNLATNAVVYPPFIQGYDSISAFTIGQYALQIDYAIHNGSGIAYDGSLVNNPRSCWTLYDTLTISPYSNNSFLTNNTIFCSGTNYVELIPDTSRGVPPYKFAIISGPQTFQLQDSGVFQIQQFGNYVISMEDICGNNYTQQISITSDSFPPIVKSGFICEGNYASLTAISSAYFTYIWHYPNGTTVMGDSISFNPFTAADTGWYQVQKIVNINGCNDTLLSSYYLSGGDSVLQSFSICIGDSVKVGSNIYHFPGIYRDTLSTVFGCDSILITAINYALLSVDSNALSICNGDSVSVGNNFYSVSGIYSDTITLAGGCKKLIVTQLSVTSIVDSVSASICAGDSFMVGSIVHQQPGIFNDTLISVSGCDSVVVATVSLTQLVIDSNALSICNGDSVSVGNNFYSVSGIYSDTITLA